MTQNVATGAPAVLEGRRVIVAGAATGIGASTVEAMLGAGAQVVGLFHRTDPGPRCAIAAPGNAATPPTRPR